MFRIVFVTIAACSLLVSPAFSQVSQDQQKQIQKRESTGEAVTQNQRAEERPPDQPANLPQCK